jgi:hypothetical protein
LAAPFRLDGAYLLTGLAFRLLRVAFRLLCLLAHTDEGFLSRVVRRADLPQRLLSALVGVLSHTPGIGVVHGPLGAL